MQGFESDSPAETEALAERLAAPLEISDLVTLSGPLGAGKTRFVAGLARGLAARARVRSPTFTLVNEYRGRIALAHLDLYRLETRDVHGLGLDELLERSAVVVEWGDKLPGRFMAFALEVRLTPIAESRRAIDVFAHGDRAVALLEAWRSSRSGAPRAAL